jgi:hypothetical protein
MVLPLPDDVPREVPRIILRSKDGRVVLNVSHQRIDLQFLDRRAEVHSDRRPTVPMDRVAEIFSALVKSENARITREALVTEWGVELAEPAPNFIVTNFMKAGVIRQSPVETELHVLHNLSLGEGLPVNRWLRIRSARSKADLTKNHFLLVQVDVNTQGDMTIPFDVDLTNRFLSAASDRIGDTLAEFLGPP